MPKRSLPDNLFFSVLFKLEPQSRNLRNPPEVAKALAADLKCGVVRVNQWAPRLHQAVLCSDSRTALAATAGLPAAPLPGVQVVAAYLGAMGVDVERCANPHGPRHFRLVADDALSGSAADGREPVLELLRICYLLDANVEEFVAWCASGGQTTVLSGQGSPAVVEALETLGQAKAVGARLLHFATSHDPLKTQGRPVSMGETLLVQLRPSRPGQLLEVLEVAYQVFGRPLMVRAGEFVPRPNSPVAAPAAFAQITAKGLRRASLEQAAVRLRQLAKRSGVRVDIEAPDGSLDSLRL